VDTNANIASECGSYLVGSVSTPFTKSGDRMRASVSRSYRWISAVYEVHVARAFVTTELPPCVSHSMLVNSVVCVKTKKKNQNFFTTLNHMFCM